MILRRPAEDRNGSGAEQGKNNGRWTTVVLRGLNLDMVTRFETILSVNPVGPDRTGLGPDGPDQAF